MSIRNCIKKHKLEAHEKAIMEAYLNDANTNKVADFKDTNDAKDAALEALDSMIASYNEKYSSIINAIGGYDVVPNSFKTEYLDVNKDNTLKKFNDELNNTVNNLFENNKKEFDKNKLINEVKNNIKKVLEKEFKNSSLINSDIFNIISSNEIPENISSQLENNQSVKAYVTDGKVFFIADNINNLNNKELLGLIKHEVSDHILKLGVKDSTYKNIIGQLKNLRENGNKEVVNAYNTVPNNTLSENIDREALAYLLENSSNLPPVSRFISWFKNKLRDFFGENILKYSVNDINFLADNALKNKTFDQVVKDNNNNDNNTLFSVNNNNIQQRTSDIVDSLDYNRFTKSWKELKYGKISKVIKTLFDKEEGSMSFFEENLNSVNYLATKYEPIKKIYKNLEQKMEVNSAIINNMWIVGKNLFLNGDTSFWGLIKSLDIRHLNRVKNDISKVWSVISERMNEEGVQGQLYNDQELRQKGLTDKQIEIYKEAFSIIHFSLDLNFKSTLMRVANSQKLNLDLNDILYKKGSNKTEYTSSSYSLNLVKDEIDNKIKNLDQVNDKQLIDNLNKIKQNLYNNYNRLLELKQKGYVPAKRFGPYILNVYKVDNNGNYILDVNGDKVLDSSMAFESPNEREVVANHIKENIRNVKVETKNISPSLLNLLKKSGINSTDAFMNYLDTNIDEKVYDENGKEIDIKDTLNELIGTYNNLRISADSPIKNLLKRKGIDGFSNDLPRVVSSFLRSNVRMMSNEMFRDKIAKAHIDIIEDDSVPKDIKDYVADYLSNLEKNKENSVVNNIKNLTFLTFLGGNISSAVLQFANIPLNILPYAISKVGSKAASFLNNSIKGATTGDFGNINNLMEIARKRDIIGDMNSFNFAQNTEDNKNATSVISRNLINGLNKGLIFFFAKAELKSREISFATGIQVAQEKGITDVEEIIQFAKDFMITTNGMQANINKSKMERNPFGSIALQFKNYITTYFEMINKMESKQDKMIALAILMVFAGAGSLPFEDDIMNLVDAVGQSMGYNANTKKYRDQIAKDLLGKELGNFAIYGISQMFPVDFSTRISMSNILPGEQVFKRSEKDTEKAIMELIGPSGGFIKSKVIDTVRMLSAGENKNAAINVMPSAFSNLAKGINMLNNGIYEDYTGKKVTSTSNTDAFLKMVGFQPSSVSELKSRSFIQKQDENYHDVVKQKIIREMAKGRAQNNSDIIKNATELLKSYNEKNYDKIRLDNSAITKKAKEYKQDLVARETKNATKDMRKFRKQYMEDNVD